MLHGVQVAGREVDAGHVLLQPRYSVVQVDLGPVAGRVAAEVTGNIVVGVRAGVPGCEGVVESGSLDDDLLVVGRLVVRDAIEARSEMNAIMSFSDRSRPSDYEHIRALDHPVYDTVSFNKPSRPISRSYQLTLRRRPPDREISELAQKRAILDPEANTEIEPIRSAVSTSSTL